MNNNTVSIRVLGDSIQFPLEPEDRLNIWENLASHISKLCNGLEEVADTLDGNPWPLWEGTPDIEKDVSADDFRATYDCLCAMADKLNGYVDKLRIEADNAEYQRHYEYIREFGLDPQTFDTFADKQPCQFEILSHPEWVAEFKQQQAISAEDTLNACAAFLIDWGKFSYKSDAGFWQYTPPSQRKAG